MKERNRRLASLALAGTITVGVSGVAYAENSEPTVIEETQEQTEKEYIVKEKDTLGKIAQKYFGNSGYWELLAKYNHLTDPNTIYVGQKIKIPTDILTLLEFDENYTEYEDDKTYTVKKGDTLYCIVRAQYGLKNQEAVDKLATYNNMSDPNRIYVGQVLLIPTIEKLENIVAYDYTDEYNRMGWILYQQEHPWEFCPFKPIPPFGPEFPQPIPPFGPEFPQPIPPFGPEFPQPEPPVNCPKRILKP